MRHRAIHRLRTQSLLGVCLGAAALERGTHNRMFVGGASREADCANGNGQDRAAMSSKIALTACVTFGTMILRAWCGLAAPI